MNTLVRILKRRPVRFGIDHSSRPPAPAALKKEGVRFVCRYLSTVGNPKNVSLAEAAALKAAGIEIVLVFETTANRALSGKAAGVADAKAARSQAGLVGLSGSPIYFAVDFDMTPAERAAVLDYFRGVASVLGYAHAGVYGGLHAVSAVLDAKIVKYGWQTYAWSGGVWDPRAQLQQYANGKTLCGISCDFDRALGDDFGQHVGPHQPPAPKKKPKPKRRKPAQAGRDTPGAGAGTGGAYAKAKKPSAKKPAPRKSGGSGGRGARAA